MNLVDIIRLKGCDYYLHHVKLKVAVLSSFRRVRYVIFGKDRIASKKIEPKEKSQFRLLRAQIVVASK